MALKLKKLKAIEFDEDFTLTPKVTTELKLRLQELKFDSTDNIKNGIEVISKCFGEDDRERVKEFLDQHATVMGLYQIQAYLAYGIEDMAERVEKSTKEMSSKN